MTEGTDIQICIDRRKSKAEIRREILQKREAMPKELRKAYSRQITEKVLESEYYRQAKTILIYVSFRSEVETMPLIRRAMEDGKEVYLPRVMPSAYQEKTGEMEFYRVTDAGDLDNLEISRWGIPEPPALEERRFIPEENAEGKTEGNTEGNTESNTEENAKENAKESAKESSNGQILMIMPGAAFDRSCNRIGYAGGFYDRYLGRFPACETMALAFSLQITDEIPAEAHDRKPSCIITESGIIH